jgi:cytidylate kinase
MEDFYLDHNLHTSAKLLGEKMREHEICLYLTGLAASGKSAVAEVVSQLTGIPIVDTGLPFRLATYICQNIPAAREDIKLFGQLLNAHTIQAIGGRYHLFSGTEDITSRLQGESIDHDVPRVAGDPNLRKVILRFLKSNTGAPAIVAARGATEPITSDSGHILQIELRAEFLARASRREKQSGLPKDTIRKSIRERDDRDLRGPSRYPSPDFIDSTSLTFEETVATVIRRTSERLARLNSYDTFRKQFLPKGREVGNPLLENAWKTAESSIGTIEREHSLPGGQVKARFLLHLSRFSAEQLLNHTVSYPEWPAGTFPTQLIPDKASGNLSLLDSDARRIARERQLSVSKFLTKTKLSPKIFEPVGIRSIKNENGRLTVTDENNSVIEKFDIRDASPELGEATEKYLHYLGIPREDSTHRLVLVEHSSDLPVLYLSFAPNTRKYTEPLLWSVGLRMEEVAVAVRGYGWPRCPQNGMGLFLRQACKRVGKDFPHLKAILTDINPNWGFKGNSFTEAGFMDIALKHAPTSFVGDNYSSRRGLEGARGRKPATLHRLSLVPTLIMLNPLNNDDVAKAVKKVTEDGLFLIPQTLYNKE